MATTIKKSSIGSPKLEPRPTAASRARAARNAINRNVTQLNKPSSSFRPSSPDLTKSKCFVGSQNDISSNLKSAKTDSKTTHNSEAIDSVQRSESKINIIEDFVQERKDESDVHEDGDKSEERGVKSYANTPSNRSRPTTPTADTIKSISRPSTPHSRPNTPHKPTRVSAKTKPPTKPNTRVQIANVSIEPVSDDENVKTSFIKRQKQFHKMKKELDLKQQEILGVFESLRKAEDLLKEEGVTVPNEYEEKELLMFNVADWPTEEISKLCLDAVEASHTDVTIESLINNTITDEKINEITQKINEMPSQFADLCVHAFHARQEVLDWAKDAVHNELGGGEFTDKINHYSNQGQELFEALNGIKIYAHASLESATQFLKRTYQDRNALQTAAEALIREMAKLKMDMETQSKILKSLENQNDSDLQNQLQVARAELEEERSAKEVFKDKLSKTEVVLRSTKARVAKMDKQLREAESSIASLTSTVKTLEDQNRKSEAQLEARARKMRESLKTGEEARSQLGHQRDALNSEIKNLKDTIATMTEQNKKIVRDLNERLKEAQGATEDKISKMKEAMELKVNAEEALKESQKEIEQLNYKINEFEKLKMNPELPSEREMDLWAELQATKESLRMTEEEVTMCKRDKIRFLETLSKPSESDSMDIQQKLAAELIGKEDIIAKMQSQIRELSKNSKLNEEKLQQYEQYVRDMQTATQNMDENMDGVHVSVEYQDLKQETINLRMALLESAHQLEELQGLLAQKDQQIENQEKASRNHASAIKMRQELINMLKNKEIEQTQELVALQRDLDCRMKIVDDVNKQIASKADEIKQLFATLETKQQQIHRLEVIVLALEDQQQRAQAQRVRNEEKIAALEHELAAFGKRERKFMFF